MTNQEFSNGFDVLLNSYALQANFGEGASNASIVLDEYEKSMFLTQAQDLVLKSYFSAATNEQGVGIDDAERRQIDFSSLITVANATRVASGISYDDRSVVFELPTTIVNEVKIASILFILNEKITVTDSNNRIVKYYVVKPINYKEYDRLMSKAYAKPLKRQAWRLLRDNATSAEADIYSEIIIGDTSYTEAPYALNYKVRYIRRPKPIILTSLRDSALGDLNIDGYSDEMSCELNPILHPEILSKAVELAYATRGTAKQESNK